MDSVYGRTPGHDHGSGAAWAGTGAVTRKMFGLIDELEPAQFDALDAAIRQPAADILKLNVGRAAKTKDPVRKDYLELLRITAEGGLKGLRQALDSKAFLPALVGAAMLPALTQAEMAAALAGEEDET